MRRPIAHTTIPTTAPSPGQSGKVFEGVVDNPGVRTVRTEGSGPICPVCRKPTLKMHMNKKQGQRVYCDNSDCNYDTSIPESGIGNNETTRVLSRNSASEPQGGVRIMRGRGV